MLRGLNEGFSILIFLAMAGLLVILLAIGAGVSWLLTLIGVPWAYGAIPLVPIIFFGWVKWVIR